MNLESNQASSSADDPANENRHAEAEMARLLIRQFRLWMAGCALQFIFVNGIYWMSGNKSVSIFLFFMILTAALVGGVVSKVFLEDRSSRFVTAPLGICILVELSIVFEKFADVFYGHRIGFPPFAIIVVVAATWAYLMVDGALRQSRLLPILGLGPDWKPAPESGSS